VRITREQIIEAIQTEPLKPGRWIDGTTSTCPVCAVGGVLRRAGVHPLRIPGTASRLCGVQPATAGAGEGALDRARALLRDGYPVNALSVAFEGLAQEHLNENAADPFDPASAEDLAAGDAAREPLIAFVRETFPDSITID
jgi:hypothetical protein